MEQNLITHHSNGRNYRSKGLDKKSFLQVVSLLAVCMWLLYQIKNSYHKHEIYNGNPENSSERNITTVLGRKGIVEYINGANAEFQDKIASQEYEIREDGGVGDDEIDVNVNEDVEKLMKLVLNGVEEATDSKISVVEITNQDSEMGIVEDNNNNNSENVQRVESFLDENGIPPDASNFVNSTQDEPELKNLHTSLNESNNFIESTRFSKKYSLIRVGPEVPGRAQPNAG